MFGEVDVVELGKWEREDELAITPASDGDVRHGWRAGGVPVGGGVVVGRGDNDVVRDFKKSERRFS